MKATTTEGMLVAVVAFVVFATAAQALLVADTGQGMDPGMAVVAMVPIGFFGVGAARRMTH